MTVETAATGMMITHIDVVIMTMMILQQTQCVAHVKIMKHNASTRIMEQLMTVETAVTGMMITHIDVVIMTMMILQQTQCVAHVKIIANKF